MTEANSDETDPNFVNLIFEGSLELPPDRDAGQRIDITFSYDENQVIHCSFLDVASNKKTEIDLKIGKVGDSDEEGQELNIDQFKIE